VCELDLREYSWGSVGFWTGVRDGDNNAGEEGHGDGRLDDRLSPTTPSGRRTIRELSGEKYCYIKPFVLEKDRGRAEM